MSILTLAAPTPGPAEEPGARSWHFTVLLDERVIGRHDFTVRPGGEGGMQVESEADFRVTALKIPFYTYVHHDREEWRDGCLRRIESDTRDNGTHLSVSGVSSADGLQVTNNSGTHLLSGCIHTFAYWNRQDIRQARQLLNAQSGDYESVSVQDEGSEAVNFAGRAVQAEHLMLITPHYRIELWYSGQGEWLALRTHAGTGRTVRYEIRN